MTETLGAAHNSKRWERHREIKAAERSASERQKVRDTARAEARASACPHTRKALGLAEAGFGILHIVTVTDVDIRIVRKLVLGETR